MFFSWAGGRHRSHCCWSVCFGRIGQIRWNIWRRKHTSNSGFVYVSRGRYHLYRRVLWMLRCFQEKQVSTDDSKYLCLFLKVTVFLEINHRVSITSLSPVNQSLSSFLEQWPLNFSRVLAAFLETEIVPLFYFTIKHNKMPSIFFQILKKNHNLLRGKSLSKLFPLTFSILFDCYSTSSLITTD